jgi:eukaryotic-like serine/threonine-protein kinase
MDQRKTDRLASHDEAPEFVDRVAHDLRSAALAPITVSQTSYDDVPLTVTVVREAHPSAVHPIEVLLRRRLRVLFAGFALIFGLATLVLFWTRVFPVLRQGASIRPFVWISFASYALLVVTAAVCARLLWSSRPFSLRALRTMELVGFSSVVLIEVSRIYVSWRAAEIFAYVPADALGITLLSGRQSLTWFALIVAYGTLIPNTWRRCAVVVGTLAATPIAAAVVCNSLFGVLDGRLFSIYLFDLSIWMVCASGFAIYGSHRIDVLRKEVIEARTLGQYQLKRLLGAGGMGEVYLAEHLLLRRPCAIKLIRRDRAGDAESLLRFEREVQATATLTHANTVQVYDYGHTDDGTFYYAMEYLPGLTLAELVKRDGPVPASRTIHLLRQICGALSEAHGRGLIHRDVKPSNIIVCERGGVRDVAKLLDFGAVQPTAAAVTEDGAPSGQKAMIGTPGFMSPEQVSRTVIVDARSDIYSLGGVAYFLLTGAPPFVRATAAQMAAAHLREPVIPPDNIRPDVPADLQAIVLRCLNKNADDRYQSADTLTAALLQCAGSQP